VVRAWFLLWFLLAEGTPANLKARLRTPERPDPTMEDAFVALIEGGA
jgi:hypothetical protein